MTLLKSKRPNFKNSEVMVRSWLWDENRFSTLLNFDKHKNTPNHILEFKALR